jgi:hypothetical protein
VGGHENEYVSGLIPLRIALKFASRRFYFGLIDEIALDRYD